MKMKAVLPLVLPLLLAPALRAQEKTLHLAIGDPARKDKEAAVVLDGITDTRSGEVITPAELPKRLAGVRLLLVGESHTDMDYHRCELRVLQELVRAGRAVVVGLEMYPYTEQRFLDDWVDGKLTEEAFLHDSRWYENWGYNWLYYRDVFLFARDHKLRIFAVNAPREVVTAVRKKGFKNLTPEEAAYIPADIDTSSPEHRTLLKSFFETGGDSLHSAMNDAQMDAMVAAQSTWDATMAFNAVKALKEHGGPDTVLAVLVGSGHVIYGLGIQRQAARHFDGRIATVVPVNVRDDEGHDVKTVQASYADFVWGLPAQADPIYPSLGLSSNPVEGEKALKVILVSEKTPAEKAGVQVGDVIVSLDGTPVPDKETLNRLVAGKRWGDEAVLVVKRGSETKEMRVALRR
ncbi:MAG TPA: ChaN family lipoprotein [Thermoanaerobaculia bacterium]|nr:ChaN family lipoprotein [Thermoanaerobaculia bacterium]